MKRHLRSACFLVFFVFLSTASAQKRATAPIPLDIPSNLIEGDISALFVEEVGLTDVIPESLISQSPADGFSKSVFIADKKAKSLSIWQFQKDRWHRVGYYPTDIGKKSGDKTLLGDHKTPEGIYFFIDRIEGRNLDYKTYGSRAFATDYPNLFDKREGKTGYGIWLHAVPDTTPLTRGSRGCVVVRDQIIQDITRFVDLKRTPIIIKEREKYLPISEWKAKKEAFEIWLENWRKAWQSQDIETYMTFYSENFRSQRKSWKGWKRYKESLKKRYSEQNIELSKPQILTHQDQVVIQFMQDFKSDKYSDYGLKTLYVKNESGQYKIIAEQWQEAPAPIHNSGHSDNSPTQVGSLEPTSDD